MSEPTSTWQKVFNQAQESRQAFDRFYESMLAELHASEHERIRLARKILEITEQTQEDINRTWESSWSGIFSSAFEDIETLCKEQLKKGEEHGHPL